MILVLVAVVALVLLTAFDADLWPRIAPSGRKQVRSARLLRRIGRRPATRHASSLGWAFARRDASSGARWWWE